MIDDRRYHYKWILIFARDIFLILAIMGVHFYTNFNSRAVFLITGMLVVWITWQISDFLNYRRRLG